MKLAHRKTSDFVSVNPSDIPFQAASLDIWDTKYRLKTKDGKPLDQDIEATYRRIAEALAAVESTQEERELWFEKFFARAFKRRNSGRTHRVQCRCSGTQAGHLDHQLHGFGDGW